jgi:uncharacterized protein (UPF0333 family)
MTDNISEKICKLVGIEPKYKESNPNYTLYHDVKPKTLTSPSNSLIEIYPDFTKPSNFVRVMQLVIEKTKVKLVTFESIEQVLNDAYPYIIASNELKQAIKQEFGGQND